PIAEKPRSHTERRRCAGTLTDLPRVNRLCGRGTLSWTASRMSRSLVCAISISQLQLDTASAQGSTRERSRGAVCCQHPIPTLLDIFLASGPPASPCRYTRFFIRRASRSQRGPLGLGNGRSPAPLFV